MKALNSNSVNLFANTVKNSFILVYDILGNGNKDKIAVVHTQDEF